MTEKKKKETTVKKIGDKPKPEEARINLMEPTTIPVNDRIICQNVGRQIPMTESGIEMPLEGALRNKWIVVKENPEVKFTILLAHPDNPMQKMHVIYSPKVYDEIVLGQNLDANGQYSQYHPQELAEDLALTKAERPIWGTIHKTEIIGIFVDSRNARKVFEDYEKQRKKEDLNKLKKKTSMNR